MGPSGKWGWPRLYWNETLFSKSKGPQSNRPRPREATPVALSKVARGLPTRLNKTSNFFRWEFQTLGFWSHVFRAWLRLRKIKVNQGFDPPPRPEFHAVYDVELGFWSWQGDWKLVGALRGHRLWRARAEISLYSWCGGMLSFLEMTHRQSPPPPHGLLMANSNALAGQHPHGKNSWLMRMSLPAKCTLLPPLYSVRVSVCSSFPWGTLFWVYHQALFPAFPRS